MSATKKLLAFDLGAESGRGLLGLFDGRKLDLQVIHRFANGPVQTLDTMHWDVLRLYSEMLAAMRKAAAEHGEKLERRSRSSSGGRGAVRYGSFSANRSRPIQSAVS